ncbi:MAG: aminotransferase class I/II-fold pyridoxal phosphate-dependent enzyme, partial [Erysipelotrichaceae bacterium]|nr:aminotransferase class I/II-fold pyridoxal phosphate-dependent enzyme [Erysipelotrichaceae bacterium]
IGLPTHMPQGAFYVFPCIQHTGLSSLEFCERLLEEQNVACIPGSAFGAAGEGYIRISYAYSIEEIKAALKRMKEFMRQFNHE